MGILIILLITDMLGRRLTLLYSMIMAFVGILITALAPIVEIKFIGLVIWGSGADIAYAIMITYISDIVAEDDRPVLFTKFMAAYSIGSIANVAFFYFLKDWVTVLLLYYSLSYVVVIIAFYFYVENPPLEIIAHYDDPRESYKAFMRMARKNEKEDHEITFEEIQRLHVDYH